MKDDGGPAFGHGNPCDGGHTGMCLRDWFAGSPAAAEYASWEMHKKPGRKLEERFGINPGSAGMMSQLCYEFADAMLAARDAEAAKAEPAWGDS